MIAILVSYHHPELGVRVGTAEGDETSGLGQLISKPDVASVLIRYVDGSSMDVERASEQLMAMSDADFHGAHWPKSEEF